jgi:SNF2 family DNA or RNA helicase
VLLLTLLDEMLNGGEKVLIFSQYVETLECLAAIIRDEAGESAILYHGGMSQTKRSAAVDTFQRTVAPPTSCSSAFVQAGSDST